MSVGKNVSVPKHRASTINRKSKITNPQRVVFGLGIDIRAATCEDVNGLGILGRQAFLETEMPVCVYGEICHAAPLSSR